MAQRRSLPARLLAAALLLGVVIAPATTATRASADDIEVLATTPSRDRPESAAIIGTTVFVGTTAGAEGAAVGDGKPSIVYGFDRSTGAARHAIEVAGEDVWRFRGIAGLTVDGDDRLYAADVQGRVLRFTVGARVHQETYAAIADLPPCVAGLRSPCSPTLDDRPALPNDLAFGPDGTLYVTDSWQATVWRIPPGGEAAVWFQDRRLDGAFGVNGIAVTPDRTSLMLTVTGDLNDVASVYRLPLSDAPTATDLVRLASWQSGGADGLAFGTSGNLYVTLFAQNAVAVVDPSGHEIRRITSPLFDEPASMDFDNRSGALVVPNHGFLHVVPEPRRIVRVPVGERGVRELRPMVP